MPRRAHGPVEHAICRWVVDYPFALRVPLNFSPAKHRDIPQVGNRSGPVPHFRRRYGRLPRLDTIQKIPAMSLAMVACRPGQMNFVRADFCFAQIGRVRFQACTRDMDPAGIADEPHPLRDVIIAGHSHHKIVAVGTLKVEVHRRIPQPILWEHPPAVDFYGACVVTIHAPLGNVDVMAAPVGDLAAGVIEGFD